MLNERIFDDYEGPIRVDQLPDFPFTLFATMKDSIGKGDCSVGVNRQGAYIALYGVYPEKAAFRRNLQFGLVAIWSMLLLFLSWKVGTMWSLLGIPLAFLGIFLGGSAAYHNQRQFGAGLCLLGIGAVYQFVRVFDIGLLSLSASLPLFYLLASLIVFDMKMQIKTAALLREDLFCLLFHSRAISLRDNKTGKSYSAELFFIRSKTT